MILFIVSGYVEGIQQALLPWGDEGLSEKAVRFVRAVVIEQPGRAGVVETTAPTPGPQDVLVKSLLAGVCRTDLEIYRGLLPASRVSYPCIPGHEWSGEVVAVGDDVHDLEPGTRVICEGNIPCRNCDMCRSGATNLCRNYDQLGYTRPGGYAELVVVPSHVVHPLDDGVSLESGVLVEPASCVLRAVERVDPKPGECFAVVGIGTLGAIALRLAALHEPRELIAFGKTDVELERAERLGATRIFRAGAEALSDTHPDIVIETAGTPEAVQLSFEVVARGGRIALLGLAGKDARVSFGQDELVRKDVTLIGSVSYTSAVWARMLELVARQRVVLDDLITDRVALEDFESAFATLDDPERDTVKVLLEHR